MLSCTALVSFAEATGQGALVVQADSQCATYQAMTTVTTIYVKL